MGPNGVRMVCTCVGHAADRIGSSSLRNAPDCACFPWHASSCRYAALEAHEADLGSTKSRELPTNV
jgi:hypothetical protein